MKINLWRAVHDCLPTGFQLRKRHIKALDGCFFCGRDDQVEHIFIQCHFAVAVWQDVKEKYGMKLCRRELGNMRQIFLNDSHETEEELTIVVGPARPDWVFTYRTPPANPRLTHRCSTTTQPLPTCGTPAPAPPAGQPSSAEDRATPTGISSSHQGHLLLCRPCLSHRTGLLHRTRLSHRSGLPPLAAPLAPSRPPSPPPAPLAPSRPLLPSAVPLCTKPVSDPSSVLSRTGQMQPSATSSASRPRPPPTTTTAAAANGHLAASQPQPHRRRPAATATVATSSASLPAPREPQCHSRQCRRPATVLSPPTSRCCHHRYEICAVATVAVAPCSRAVVADDVAASSAVPPPPRVCSATAGYRYPKYSPRCYYLAHWEARNNAKNNNESIHPKRVAQKFFAYVDMIVQHCYKAQAAPRGDSSPSIPRWTPPPVGTVMINCDAALFQSSCQMGIGFLIRDHDGRCLLALNERVQNVTQPELAEAVAIRRALSLAKEEGYQKHIH
nr:hypothetical protein [Oryza sativa Japonica Group]AAR00641.1 hypothetical protein [Oryza sativa Japonica Group]